MNQISRFVPLMLDGVDASAIGYFATVSEAQNAYDALAARHLENNKGKGLGATARTPVPVLVGIFGALINVPDFNDLDPFTREFLTAVPRNNPSELGRGVLDFGPDTMVFLDYWSVSFQLNDVWTDVKDATFPDGGNIWNLPIVAGVLWSLINTGTAEYPINITGLPLDVQEFVTDSIHGFMDMIADLPTISISLRNVEGALLWSVFNDGRV